MSKIFLLDSHTVDKIAAGEVVESPSACLKELIDNALDASATEICIEIEVGGRQKIEVKDNGIGMSPEDVPLAIQRFATSKISVIEDLERLSTMGFRGEALSAISSVSYMTIITNDGQPSQQNTTNDAFWATSVEIEAGLIKSIGKAVRDRGTTIRVSSLFFNVPARRKFLKPPSKEEQEISRTVQALALANPHVAFKLFFDGSIEFDLPRETLFERVRRFFPSIAQGELIPVEFKLHNSMSEESGGEKSGILGISCSGFIGSPNYLRPNRQGQYLSINKRPIHSLSLSYAIRDGFGPSCESTKFPIFILNIEIDPSEIDVNIHPQKKEIRFYQEEWLKTRLRDQIAKAILGHTMPSHSSHTHSLNASENVSDIEERSYAPPHFLRSTDTLSFSDSIALEPLQVSLPELEPERGYRAHQIEFEAFSFEIVSLQNEYCFVLLHETILRKMGVNSSPSLLGVLSLNRLKQKASFLHFSRRIQDDALHDDSHNFGQQILLEPKMIRMNTQEARSLTELLPYLEQCGFAIRSFGSSSFFIEAFPEIFLGLDIDAFIKDLIEVQEDGRIGSNSITKSKFVEALAKIGTTRIPRGEVKQIESKQVQLLLKELFISAPPYNDLSGKPLIHIFTQDELHKLF